jgi:hypothetical protein
VERFRLPPGVRRAADGGVLSRGAFDVRWFGHGLSWGAARSASHVQPSRSGGGRRCSTPRPCAVAGRFGWPGPRVFAAHKFADALALLLRLLI